MSSSLERIFFRPVGDNVSRQQKTWPLDIAVEKKKCGETLWAGEMIGDEKLVVEKVFKYVYQYRIRVQCHPL